MDRQYKYKTKFTATARCLVDKEKGKYLAKASLDDLKALLPKDAADFPDLLAIAGNVCVANLGNANGDAIDTDIALAIAPQFVHKYINLEHKDIYNVGHITNYALTAFSSNYALGGGSEILSIDDVKGKYEPFNIGIGGYIWRANNDGVIEKIMASNDPDSEDYLEVSFSWEVFFDEYVLQVGSKSRSDASIISDKKQIEEWEPLIKGNGGNGKTPSGEPLYRLLAWAKTASGEIDYTSVIAGGAALTLQPAGEVAGIVTSGFKSTAAMDMKCPECGAEMDSTEMEDMADEEKVMCAKCKKDSTMASWKGKSTASDKNNEKNENKSSQKSNNTVTNNTKTMKVLKSLADIKSLNDENKTEFSLANISHVVEASLGEQIAAEITTKAKEWEDKVNAEKNATKEASEKAEKAVAQVTELEKKVAEANTEIAKLRKEQADAAATAKFNERMAGFDDKYELTDPDRKALAARIQNLTDEEFQKVLDNELSVFLAPKDKAELAKANKGTEENKGNTVKKALANVTTPETVPNTTTDTQVDFKTKYADAFKVGGGVEFQPKRIK